MNERNKERMKERKKERKKEGKNLTHQENSNMNSLLFWKLHHKNFPKLSKLARKYLAVPITSCPSERLFKVAKKTKFERELLNNEEFEIQTLLSKNLNSFTRLNFFT